MRSHPLDPWQHAHDFGAETGRAETRTTAVMALTAAMMVVEVGAGLVYGSMALLADGWHMATHVAAFAIAVFAYRYARRHAGDPRFAFGTGKVGALGGFASAVALAVVALVMALESVARAFDPQPIRFDEAIAVAVAGLAVNLLSGWILHGAHEHEHDHAAHEHEHDAHAHHDHNLRAAYLHVLADALTSVFAIVALLAGKWLGWLWLDPAMGLVGAAVILRWSRGLLRDTAYLLLDGAVGESTRNLIRASIEEADSHVADLHVWAVGRGHYSAMVSVVTHGTEAPEHFKQRLRAVPHLSHVLVEVNRCDGGWCSDDGAEVVVP